MGKVLGTLFFYKIVKLQCNKAIFYVHIALVFFLLNKRNTFINSNLELMKVFSMNYFLDKNYFDLLNN